MFYCTECADKWEWPVTMFQSFGPCEMCGRSRSCNEVPSRYLPDPKEKNEVC